MVAVVGWAFAVSPDADRLRLPEGDHVYVLAPLAVSLIPLPRHIYALLGVTLIVGLGLTVTTTLLWAEHPVEELVVVRKYVCTVGEPTAVNVTVGFAMVLEFSPKVGVHE